MKTLYEVYTKTVADNDGILPHELLVDGLYYDLVHIIRNNTLEIYLESFNEPKKLIVIYDISGNIIFS